MSEFEDFISSQGFGGDFQRGCNGQYKSDLLHFMEKAFMHQQTKIDELQRRLSKVDGLIISFGDNISVPLRNSLIDAVRGLEDL